MRTTIEAIRELPVEKVLADYITLKQTGGLYKACCPFHDEKTPSFVVSRAKGTFTCYGCGAWGDSIEFVMQHEKVSFMEACSKIAADHGIAFEEPKKDRKSDEQKKEQEAILSLLQQAKISYRKSLDLPAVKYLVEQRRLSRETIIEWGIGLCPDWKILTPEVIASNQFSQAEKAGLVRTSGSNTYDFFHHRIVVPIADRIGRVVGFGGRVLPGAEGPKYLNSPESSIYKKSSLLFGLNKARKNFSRHGMACLVEGYFDVIKMHQVGWGNAVATCGIALTEKQVEILKGYTDTVLVLRDGDKAGRQALEKDIPLLAASQFNILVAQLPEGEDPDTLFDCWEKVVTVLSDYQDGIEWLCGRYLADRLSTGELAEGIEKCVELLLKLNSQIRIDQYVAQLHKRFKLPKTELSKAIREAAARLHAEREKEREAILGYDDELPEWVDRKHLEVEGFVQLSQDRKGFKPGIYFKVQDGNALYRVTNFAMQPLYHVYEQSNNRRLIEVNNGARSAVVEMPTQAFVNQNNFEIELLHRGNYRTEIPFNKNHFKRIIGWMSENMPIAYELKTLGWQPEGFFAFSDCVWYQGNMIRYDEMGMIRIDDKFYLSMGRSKIHRDERFTDNSYENDLYLQHKQSPISLAVWARLFCNVYGENAPAGIAFVFLTLFKDIVARIAKMPLLYCYGPKGSGKSDMAESITWLFFSGKNAEGNLIQAYNLNPGQGTRFSFFNRLERFRNCPILMNEFDENFIEDWAFGAFKAAYDGEGREVGDGSTGKKLHTKIQKVQGTVIIVGQYISIKDDGSVLSRSVTCQFSLSRLSNLTHEALDAHQALKDAEASGVSSLLLELLARRNDVIDRLPGRFLREHAKLMDETRKAGERIEARLLNNYGLALAANSLLSEFIDLPFTYDSFFEQMVRQVITHNRFLKDNSAIHLFWRAIEFLFDKGFLNNYIRIEFQMRVSIRDSRDEIKEIQFNNPKNVLYIHFSNAYAEYSRYQRERSGKPALPQDTLMLYMKDQPYFIGSVKQYSFDGKRTSAYAFDYDAMKEFGIVLEKDNWGDGGQNSSSQYEKPANNPPPASPKGEQKDFFSGLPF